MGNRRHKSRHISSPLRHPEPFLVRTISFITTTSVVRQSNGDRSSVPAGLQQTSFFTPNLAAASASYALTVWVFSINIIPNNSFGHRCTHFGVGQLKAIRGKSILSISEVYVISRKFANSTMERGQLARSLTDWQSALISFICCAAAWRLPLLNNNARVQL